MLRSSWIKISEFAVTAVEATVTVVADVAIVTRPAAADPHVPAADAQFVAVAEVAELTCAEAVRLVAVIAPVAVTLPPDTVPDAVKLVAEATPSAGVVMLQLVVMQIEPVPLWLVE